MMTVHLSIHLSTCDIHIWFNVTAIKVSAVVFNAPFLLPVGLIRYITQTNIKNVIGSLTNTQDMCQFSLAQK